MSEQADDEVKTLDHADDQIAADWEKIQEKYTITDEADTREDAPEKVEAKPAKAEKTAEDKPRDDKGKFTKADAKAEGEPAPETAAAPADAAQAPAVATAGETALPEGQKGLDLNRAPSSWKPGAKAAWAALPEDIRSEVLRRENDFLKGQGELMADARAGQQFRKMLEPYAASLQAQGGPERALVGLLQTEAILRNGTPFQKRQAIDYLTQYYGIQAGGQIGGTQNDATQQQAAPPQPFQDPRVDALMSHLQAQERQRDEAETAQVNQAIEEFEAAVDAKGQPVRPFVTNVADAMTAMIPALKAQNPRAPYSDILQKAYDAAVWANPETRAVVQKQQLEQAEAKRREESLRLAAEAKKAASVNVARRSAPATQGARVSMDQTILDTARKLGMVE